MLPWALCGILFCCAAVLAVKVRLLQKSMDEICSELEERLSGDTNNLIFLSSRDRHARRLAAQISVQLRLLRRQRQRYLNGDRELKEAVTNISHDLRTPLTAICGYLELLREGKTDADAARYLKLIENRVEAMRQLAEELFRYSVALSDGRELSPETISLNGALEEEIAEFYGALTSRGITPSIRMPEKPVLRRLDRRALSRILDNILANALKYSDGDLDICLLPEGETVFSNGAAGLEETEVGRLFDRFFSLETARSSSGLGLSIARALTEQMGGGISARYDQGRLYIHLIFPALEEGKGQAAGDSPQKRRPPGRNASGTFASSFSAGWKDTL